MGGLGGRIRSDGAAEDWTGVLIGLGVAGVMEVAEGQADLLASVIEFSDYSEDELIPDLDDDDEDFEPKAVVVKGSNKPAAAKNNNK